LLVILASSRKFYSFILALKNVGQRGTPNLFARDPHLIKLNGLTAAQLDRP